MKTKAALALLLTETLLGQVHVDDEEHESTGSFLLSSNKCVHPAFKTFTRKLSHGHVFQTGGTEVGPPDRATTLPYLWISAQITSFQVLRGLSDVPDNVPG